MRGGYRVVEREWRFDVRRGEDTALLVEVLRPVRYLIGVGREMHKLRALLRRKLSEKSTCSTPTLRLRNLRS